MREVIAQDQADGAASAVIQAYFQIVVVKGELSIYNPLLTYGHELWVITDIMR